MQNNLLVPSILNELDKKDFFDYCDVHERLKDWISRDHRDILNTYRVKLNDSIAYYDLFPECVVAIVAEDKLEIRVHEDTYDPSTLYRSDMKRLSYPLMRGPGRGLIFAVGARDDILTKAFIRAAEEMDEYGESKTKP
jgi:hypothetical protein